MARSRIIDVCVSKQVLWVGSEAYPLQNIARARTTELAPRRWPAVRACILAVVLWLAIGVAGKVAPWAVGSLGSGRASLISLLQLGAAALIAICVVRLLVALTRRTLYALEIETAGRPSTALISYDRQAIDNLVHEIMDAINNPAAKFHYRIQNVYGGNHVTVGGHHNVGMVNN